MAKLVRKPIPGLPNFNVMTPVTIPLYGSAIARRLNSALVRAQVRAVLRALGINCPAYIVTIPTAWDVVRPMERRCLVYNRSDLHSSFPEADRKLIEGYEAKLLNSSDHVCYVSRELMRQEQPNPERERSSSTMVSTSSTSAPSHETGNPPTYETSPTTDWLFWGA